MYVHDMIICHNDTLQYICIINIQELDFSKHKILSGGMMVGEQTIKKIKRHWSLFCLTMNISISKVL